MNVLIVDDDKLARKGLIAVIDWERYGLCVVGDVQNGKKALEFLENHPVDLVFTDIDMPEMNGLELMKICKENYPETDFVIFSVYEDFPLPDRRCVWEHWIIFPKSNLIRRNAMRF